MFSILTPLPRQHWVPHLVVPKMAKTNWLYTRTAWKTLKISCRAMCNRGIGCSWLGKWTEFLKQSAHLFRDWLKGKVQGVHWILCFPKNSRKFATFPSPALGCYWLCKKLPACIILFVGEALLNSFSNFLQHVWNIERKIDHIYIHKYM